MKLNLFQWQFNKVSKAIQDQNDRNQAALVTLRKLGFPMKCIRKALLDLNELTVQGLAGQKPGVATPTLYNTLRGERGNDRAKAVLAGQLKLKVEEMFPPDEKISN